MSKVSEKAARAERLRASSAFKEFTNEVLEDQAAVFMNPFSKPEEREEAHAIVRAMNAVVSRLTAAEADLKFEQKKGQHRGSD